jgi:hypothetical protein
VEYAYAYVGGTGWFGLYVTGQMVWLMPLLLHDDVHESIPEVGWMRPEWLGLTAGTVLVTTGLLSGTSPMVALGAAVNLAVSLLMAVRSVRLCWAQPAMAER